MITNDQIYSALKILPQEFKRQWIETQNRFDAQQHKLDLLCERFETFYTSYFSVELEKKQNTLFKRVIKWFKS